MTSATSGPTCGNCGASVTADAVTCPVCGVLLAAYQTTGGSEAVSIDSPSGSAAFDPVSTDQPAPEPAPLPASPPPPFRRPTSMSPTARANLHAHWRMQSDLHPGDALPEPTGPDDLTRMASGDDELADMADGEDELSAMASGRDELSTMASEAGGSFEAEVNAELAGAKVVFDHGKPVIEADMVEVIDPGEGDPEVVEHPPTAPRPAAQTPPSRPEPRPTRPSPAERGRLQQNASPVEVVDQQSARQPIHNAGSNPTRVPAAPSWQSIPVGTSMVTPPRTAWGKLVASITAIPFLLIVCMILAVGRGTGGFMGISFITLGLIVYLLVRAAGLTRRKTTSMPRDDALNRRK